MIAARPGPRIPLAATLVFAIALAACAPPRAVEAVAVPGDISAGGSSYSGTAVVAFFTTGYCRDNPGAPWRHRDPNAYGKWVVVSSNVGRIEDPRDAEAAS